jgi:hypothetical protein
MQHQALVHRMRSTEPIYIRMVNDTIPLRFSIHDAVADVRRKIRVRYGQINADGVFIHAGHRLDDGKKLLEYNIESFSILHLLPRLSGGMQRAVEDTGELQTLKLGDLRKRAAEAGATPDEIDNALNADDAKSSLVSLILRKQQQSMADPIDAQDTASGSAMNAARRLATTKQENASEVELSWKKQAYQNSLMHFSRKATIHCR